MYHWFDKLLISMLIAMIYLESSIKSYTLVRRISTVQYTILRNPQIGATNSFYSSKQNNINLPFVRSFGTKLYGGKRSTDQKANFNKKYSDQKTNYKKKFTPNDSKRPSQRKDPIDIEYDNNQPRNIDSVQRNKPPKSYAAKTILGDNIINCRTFSIDSQKKFQFIGSFNRLSSMDSYPLPEIAFIGRSNVGKSSLLNCLTGSNKNIAIESKTPGRTQAINLFKCSDNEGELCLFVDLPGYGFAKMSKSKQEDISRFLFDYLQNRKSLRHVILLIDSRRDQQSLDVQMIELLNDIGVSYSVVATKVDKLTRGKDFDNAMIALRTAYQLTSNQPIPFSALTGFGKKDVWKEIRNGIVGISNEEDDDDEVKEQDDTREVKEPSVLDEFYEDIRSAPKMNLRTLRKLRRGMTEPTENTGPTGTMMNQDEGAVEAEEEETAATDPPAVATGGRIRRLALLRRLRKKNLSDDPSNE